MATSSHNPSPDDTPRIAGFDILEKVGEGGMGAVYRAKQLSLDRIVALKTLSPKLAADPKYTDSFLREARSAARLNHPNIIPIYDAGKADDLYYYTMEFIHGESLQKWVTRDGALPESTALDLTLCVANALKFAWDKAQLIHRDIKPDNIIVDTHGNVKLCDLGLAKYFGENTLLSLSGQVFGTPNYMSPEQARAEKVDCRTDIYALGLTLYYALTGNIPFHGGTAAMVMSRHMNELLPDPRDVVPSVSLHIVRIIEKMASKKEDDRYASWDEVIRDLQRARESHPPQIEQFFMGNSSVKRNTVGAQPIPVAASVSERTPLAHARGYEQKKSPIPLLALVAILCLTLGGGTAWMMTRASTPSTQNPNPPPLVGNPPFPQPPNPHPPIPNPASRTTTTTTTYLDITSLKTYEAHTDRISGVAFTPDGKHAVSSSFDGTLKYWDLITGTAMRTFRGHNGWVWSVAVSPDGKLVLSAGEDGTVRLWNELGKELAQFRGHEGAVRRVAFSADGRYALSSGRDATARMLVVNRSDDLSQGTLQEWRNFRGHTAGVNAAAFLPDGQRVLTASQDKTLKLWERDSGREAKSISASSKNVWFASLSPDGRLALSCGEESTAKLWDLNAGNLIRSYDTRTEKVTAALFTPNGRGVLTAGYDKTARLWDAESGRELAALRGHTDLIECAALSPDGQFALTGSADKTLKLWKLSGGEIAVAPPNLSGPDALLREQTIGNWQKLQNLFGGMGKIIVLGEPSVEFFADGTYKTASLPPRAGRWTCENGVVKLDGETWKVTIPGREMEMGGFLLKKINPTVAVAPPITVIPPSQTTLTATPKADAPWENSLGMKFVPVKGTDVLFSIWETRVQDFEAFVKITGHDATKDVYSMDDKRGWGQYGDAWNNPRFLQAPNHPVCGISRNDAKAFCDWLTKIECEKGRISAKHYYRLPTDTEWSVAVGLSREIGGTPDEKSKDTKNDYPWGREWPPPKNAGNYGQTLKVDGYQKTSPVASFPPNSLGLFDLSGNVWEWCEDFYDRSGETGVLRGASYGSDASEILLSSFRDKRNLNDRYTSWGFRCVLVVDTTVADEHKRAEDQTKALQGFGEFQKAYLAALARRDYAGADKQAQEASANPAWATLKERAEAFAAVAQRLQQFWTKGFPEALAQLKGKEITVQGEKGAFTEVVNGELVLEKKIGDSGVVEAAVSISKLTLDEIAALLAMAKPRDKETLLNLAWFYFLEGKSSKATEQLNAAEKAGADTKETRQVMEWLAKPPEIPRAATTPLPVPAVPDPYGKVWTTITGINREWKSTWTRRGSTNVFDSVGTNPSGLKVTGVVKITIEGKNVTTESTTDRGETWICKGTISDDGKSVRGTEYNSSGGLQGSWEATIFQEANLDPDDKLREQTIGTWKLLTETGIEQGNWEFFADGSGKSREGTRFTWKVENGNIQMNGNTILKVVTSGKEMKFFNTILKKVADDDPDALLLNQKIRDLIGQFVDPESKSRGAAHNELERIGRPALPQLRESLKKAEQQGDQTTVNQLRTLIQKIERTPEPSSSNPPADSDAKLREQTIGTWELCNEGKKTSIFIQFFSDGAYKTNSGSSGRWQVENGVIKYGSNTWKVIVLGSEMAMASDPKIMLKKAQDPSAADPDAKLREQTIGTWDVFHRIGNKVATWELGADGRGKSAQGSPLLWKIEDGLVRIAGHGDSFKISTAGEEMTNGTLIAKKVKSPADARLREQTLGTWDFYHEEGNKSGVTYQFLADGSLKISSVPGMPFQWKAEGGFIKLGQDFKDVWKINAAGKEMQRAVANSRGTATLKKALNPTTAASPSGMTTVRFANGATREFTKVEVDGDFLICTDPSGAKMPFKFNQLHDSEIQKYFPEKWKEK